MARKRSLEETLQALLAELLAHPEPPVRISAARAVAGMAARRACRSCA